MYTAFFNLKEIPFSIAPNPDYLFMSDRHREALTHLTHGLGDTGGFVLLTGEVGTGKTTISRCLMEQLPDNIQSAFILNPTLSSHELLATICDELKIRYRKAGATLKTLTDKIQEKLLSNHENNMNTLLIVDEAQHLQPEVLEQLRLLTNLETNTKKLLQVILIGQPELQALLRRRDLRQLAQRITARYHLLPLTRDETARYIKHRLSVAECHRPLFSIGAVSTIHKLSQGIPRLINLLCDRSLMNSYNANDSVVSKKTVIKASVEALGDEFAAETFWAKPAIKIAAGVTGLLIVLMTGFGLGQGKLGIESTHKVVSELKVAEPSVIAKETNENLVNDKSAPDKDKGKEKIDQELAASIAKLNASIESIKSSIAEQNNKSLVSRLPQELVENDVSDLAENNLPVADRLNDTTDSKPDVNYSVDQVDGVSDDLLSRFQSAIDDTAGDTTNSDNFETDNQHIPPLSEMPNWVQEGVPSLNFEMHIYSSDKGAGWVRVNGRDRYEGDKISQGLFMSKILPQKVVLTYRGEKFTLPALSSW